MKVYVVKRAGIISLAVFAAIVAFAFSSSCNSESFQAQNLTGAEADSAVARGNALYTEYCAGCHGAVMGSYFADNEMEYGSSDEDLFISISKGRAAGAMPGFGGALSEQDIQDLITAIKYSMEHYDAFETDSDVSISDTFEAEDFSYKLNVISSDFDSPWGIAFLPDGNMLVTDKDGELYRVTPAGKQTEIGGVPEVVYESQGGLMDVELHPDFENNNIIYLSYSLEHAEDSDLATTAVSRYVLSGDELSNGERIFEALPYLRTRHHYGSRIEFDDAGYMYISVGDRGRRDQMPQSLDVYPGKVHRLHDDGRIPADNPFYGQDEAVHSIFTYGHRNQQGMVKNPWTGELWAHEHGPRGGDELNILHAGNNYGWPVISYGINYDGTVFTELTEKEGMEQPIEYWVPSIAPCGMEFITSDVYPGWKGALMIGALRFRYVALCKLNGDQVVSQEKIMPGVGRVRVMREGPDGYIYVGIESPGKLIRIEPVEE